LTRGGEKIPEGSKERGKEKGGRIPEGWCAASCGREKERRTPKKPEERREGCRRGGKRIPEVGVGYPSWGLGEEEGERRKET